jgi:[ribosomal protein S5]-alanine N-acetyltransferase
LGFLTGLLTRQPNYNCKGKQVTLREPRMEDFAAWRELRQSSRSFLEPWEPTWKDDELLASSYRKRMQHYARLAEDDAAYAFFIFDDAQKQLLGSITLSNVRRGVALMATLGYWIGAQHARQGHMTDAINTLVQFSADALDLHRLEAACLPANTASMRLLERTGFTREGFAKNYLKIAGKWEDHVLWGRTTVQTVV